MGIGATYEHLSDREEPGPPKRHGCAGPQNPFTPFEASAVEGSITGRFEAQVANQPQAPAITDGVHRWSYAELNGLANRIGAELLGNGPLDGAPIGLLFEHCAPAIAAMLGVLKAGRVYVPLNTHQPAARLARILQDCGAKTIVTNDRNAALAAEITGQSAEAISIDRFCDERASNLDVTILPTDLASILFTSGSTGVPKGVVHNQRTVLHGAMNHINHLRMGAGDRLTQLYAYDTGAGTACIYGALLSGASLNLFDIRARGFVELANWLGEEKITVYHSVPQVFRHLVAALGPEVSFPALRVIRVGGEAATIADVELYRQHFSKGAFLQISMGSTEIAPIRGLFIEGDTRFDGPIVPAGYEMPDTEVLILDDDGREVAPGTAGQIAIRSEFLFCNYWHNAALTAAVITAEPDGRRIFRTGVLPSQLAECDSGFAFLQDRNDL